MSLVAVDRSVAKIMEIMKQEVIDCVNPISILN